MTEGVCFRFHFNISKIRDLFVLVWRLTKLNTMLWRRFAKRMHQHIALVTFREIQSKGRNMLPQQAHNIHSCDRLYLKSFVVRNTQAEGLILQQCPWAYQTALNSKLQNIYMVTGR
jgi:hypothetical protein